MYSFWVHEDTLGEECQGRSRVRSGNSRESIGVDVQNVDFPTEVSERSLEVRV